MLLCVVPHGTWTMVTFGVHRGAPGAGPLRSGTAKGTGQGTAGEAVGTLITRGRCWAQLEPIPRHIPRRFPESLRMLCFDISPKASPGELDQVSELFSNC